MATKKQSTSNVTRIKASSSKSSPKTAPKSVAPKKASTAASKSVTPKSRAPKGLLAKVFRPFTLLGGYFKGAWVELRQVRWPNRQATWGLTLAVLLFTAFFAVLILLLDAGFKYLFELLLT